MAYEDEPSQEMGANNQNLNPSSADEKTEEGIGKSFICIKEIRPISRAKALRLKNGDVIVGIRGEVFNGSVEELLDIFDEIDDQDGGILTIWREGFSFNLIIYGPLGCIFEFTPDEITRDINKALPEIQMGNVDELVTFELLRGIDSRCNVFDTRVSQLGIYLPPIWLIQQRLWEPLVATLAIYVITLTVHWVLFVISAILLALYFRKSQLVLLRSFNLHKGRQIWMIIASKNMIDAQRTARLFDPNIVFEPDLIGPPPPVESVSAKKKKKRKSSIPSQ